MTKLKQQLATQAVILTSIDERGIRSILAAQWQVDRGGEMMAHCGKNWNCDGDHCTDPYSEVRVYPLGSGGNLILCQACAAHENAYRYQRGKDTGRPKDWPQVNWFECRVCRPCRG